MMNKLLNVPQRNLPTETPSGCFSDILRCLLCGGTVSTRSSVSSPTPHFTSVSRKFVDLLQNGDQVRVLDGNLLLPDHQRTKVELPIVARLMGLETPVDMNWQPRVMDESFNRRSRSVNSVDCLLPHFISPERDPRLLHRRVKTCLSFRKRDYLVVCLEKSSKSSSLQCDQKRVKDALADHQSGADKTERSKKGNGRTPRVEGSSSSSRRANACVKSESEQTRHSTVRIKSCIEHTNQLKMGTTSCERTIISRTARGTWQNKDDYYYRKPQAIKNQPRTKEAQKRVVDRSSKSKSTKHRKNVNDMSGRLCSSPTQSRKTKARTDNVKLQTEERRRSRKIKAADPDPDPHGAESFGEGMMKKIKCIIEQDLEMKRWNWDSEGGFLYREYLSMVIELGILDELVNHMVQDLAYKFNA